MIVYMNIPLLNREKYEDNRIYQRFQDAKKAYKANGNMKHIYPRYLMIIKKIYAVTKS